MTRHFRLDLDVGDQRYADLAGDMELLIKLAVDAGADEVVSALGFNVDV